MAAITICSDFGAQKNKVWHCFHCFPSVSHELMGLDAMILVFWMLSFKLTFSFSSFTFLKRLFSSSSLYAIRVVSSAYLRLLIFLLTILIPACASFSSAFLMMYYAKIRPGADSGSDHELLIAKFRLKLKIGGKTTRPFRYDLHQIPYDYTV